MHTIEGTPRRGRETYTPGYIQSATAFMAARTLESHAGFVQPLLDRGLEILDAGCGPGTITQGLAEAVLPGRVTGIDFDPGQITRATRLAEGLELTNARFLTASIYELPQEDASFDLAFSHALFEHLSDPHAALGELRRVLRPGGLIALCSPDWDEFEMRNATPEARDALTTYRALQSANGGNTRAGGLLTTWLQDTGFGIVRHGERQEIHESPTRVATLLALQLEAADRTSAGRALLDWATEPGAEFVGCWKHAIGIKWNR